MIGVMQATFMWNNQFQIFTGHTDLKPQSLVMLKIIRLFAKTKMEMATSGGDLVPNLLPVQVLTSRMGMMQTQISAHWMNMGIVFH